MAFKILYVNRKNEMLLPTNRVKVLLIQQTKPSHLNKVTLVKRTE